MGFPLCLEQFGLCLPQLDFDLRRVKPQQCLARLNGLTFLHQHVANHFCPLVLSLIIDALAPTFNGTKDKVQSMKVAVYSMTAAWVASIFNLFPALAWLGGLLGLYGFYLLYLGLPTLMKTPQDKALGYTVVVVISAIVLAMVASAIAAGVVASFVVGTIGLGALALS